MRKAIGLSAFLVIASFAYPAEVKVMAGFSFSRSTRPVQGGGFDLNYRPIYSAGAILGSGLELDLSGRTAIEVDVLYIQKGSKIKVTSGDIVVERYLRRMGELSLPVFLKYHMKPGTSPYILGGGELAVVLAEAPKSVDYGLIFGVGFRKHIPGAYVCFEGRYHHGLRDMRTESWGLRKMRAFALLVVLSI